MKADEFDEKFDRGDEVIATLDMAKAQRPGEHQRRVSIDFPAWMIAALDRETRRFGVTRQAMIKVWLGEHLEHHTHRLSQQPHRHGPGSRSHMVR